MTATTGGRSVCGVDLRVGLTVSSGVWHLCKLANRNETGPASCHLTPPHLVWPAILRQRSLDHFQVTESLESLTEIAFWLRGDAWAQVQRFPTQEAPGAQRTRGSAATVDAVTVTGRELRGAHMVAVAQGEWPTTLHRCRALLEPTQDLESQTVVML